MQRDLYGDGLGLYNSSISYYLSGLLWCACMQSTCHCHSMWLLPCYANSRYLLAGTALSVGLLLSCKVQELSMFHVLKVGGTRNATNTRKSPTKKKETFCRHATHTHIQESCVWVGTSHWVAPSFQLALTHRNFYFVTFSASYVALPLFLSRLAMRLIIRRIRVFTQFSIDSMAGLACAWLTRPRSLKAFKIWCAAAMTQWCHNVQFKIALIMLLCLVCVVLNCYVNLQHVIW